MRVGRPGPSVGPRCADSGRGRDMTTSGVGGAQHEETTELERSRDVEERLHVHVSSGAEGWGRGGEGGESYGGLQPFTDGPHSSTRGLTRCLKWGAGASFKAVVFLDFFYHLIGTTTLKSPAARHAPPKVLTSKFSLSSSCSPPTQLLPMRACCVATLGGTELVTPSIEGRISHCCCQRVTPTPAPTNFLGRRGTPPKQGTTYTRRHPLKSMSNVHPSRRDDDDAPTAAAFLLSSLAPEVRRLLWVPPSAGAGEGEGADEGWSFTSEGLLDWNRSAAADEGVGVWDGEGDGDDGLLHAKAAILLKGLARASLCRVRSGAVSIPHDGAAHADLLRRLLDDLRAANVDRSECEVGDGRGARVGDGRGGDGTSSSGSGVDDGDSALALARAPAPNDDTNYLTLALSLSVIERRLVDLYVTSRGGARGVARGLSPMLSEAGSYIRRIPLTTPHKSNYLISCFQ